MNSLSKLKRRSLRYIVWEKLKSKTPLNSLAKLLLRKPQDNNPSGTKENDTPEFFNQTLQKKTFR